MATTVIGTPLYMAPEVLDGKDYSFSSDVWALGREPYNFSTADTVASMLSAQPDLRPSVDQLLRDSIARVHIRRYCVDRLRSTDMTEEEQRVLFQQMTVLGNDTR
ncbi:Protein kinase-like domain [Phytophthora cactorum]|nr:Protein kinase-like domain [Phytophthora cactorum]